MDLCNTASTHANPESLHTRPHLSPACLRAALALSFKPEIYVTLNRVEKYLRIGHFSLHFLLSEEQGARGELAGGDIVILVKRKHVLNMSVEKNYKVTVAHLFLLAEMLGHYFSLSGGKAAER